MVSEVIAALAIKPDGTYIDGTVGEGGHAKAILGALGPGGRLFGVDRDPEALEIAAKAIGSQGRSCRLIRANFRDLPDILPPELWGRIDGILLDLGLRSGVLDDPQRGFAFRIDGPLDMRFDPSTGETAAELLGRIGKQELIQILEEGTTRANPRSLARAILAWRRERRLQTTQDLGGCLRKALGHRATPKLLSSVFSALRMRVNGELHDLERALEELPGLLRTGGVLCVIAYQSQEDRPVKLLRRDTLRDPASGESFRMQPLYRKPLRPSEQESRRNRRARSARLRAFRRVPMSVAT